MKKLVLSFAILPFVIAGCGSSDTPAATTTGTTGPTATATPPAAASAKDQVVGTWKVDMGKSKLEGMSDKDKAEGEKVGADIKADGTYVSHGPSGDKSGTWKLDGKKISFSEKDGDLPPTMDLSDDGSQLSFTMPEGGKSVTVVMVKA
jgi:hypothetical protein